MMRCVLFSFFGMLFSVYSWAQIDSTFKEKFISPVKHDIRLSGSFGELRNNHYHTGIDIKGKNSTSGDSLFAAMSGFISRIRVQSGSYGKSLFIDHPNGITTVYAHLDQFAPFIESIIETKQRSFSSYAIDFYLPADSLSIHQGSFIGFLGNTGRSYGPHLHFECRITETELPVDPLYYDFGITDHKSPFFQKLLIHELDSNYQIINRLIKDPFVKEINSSSPLVGIGFKGFDQMDGSNNYNGIADIKMYVNNKLRFHCAFDTLSFYEMKYINASIDYELKQESNSTYFMCYKLPSNYIRNIKKAPNSGLVTIDQSANIKIAIMDRSGNRTVSNFNINYKPKSLPSNEEPLRSSEVSHTIKKPGINISIPKDGFYKPTRLPIAFQKVENHSNLAIGKHTTACHKYYDLIITDLTNFISNKNQLQLYHNKDGKLTNMGGEVKNDTFFCSLNRFGSFVLKSDISKPTIEALQDVRINQDLLLRIKDDSDVSGRVEDISIHCFVDGIWTPIYYKSLVHIMRLEGKYITKNTKEIKVIAQDSRKNRTEWKYLLSH